MKSVLIIGAGPAGLTAAYELVTKHGNEYSVVVLEETDRIGGISQTVRYHGNRMDIGGHRFFSKDKRVTQWWNDIMPIQGSPSVDDKLLNRNKSFAVDGPDPELTDRVMLIRDRVSRIYYKNHFFDYPVSMKWDTIKSMGFITTMQAGFSYLAAVVHKLPETSLESFYINRFGKKLYSMFFEGYTEKLWGRHPRDISADWGAQRVKGLSIRAVFKDMFRKLFHRNSGKVETSLIEQFVYPKFGPGQLWETVADEFVAAGGKIIKNARVDGFEVNGGRIAVADCTIEEKHTRLGADVFISSMPLNNLIAGIEDENMPELVRNYAEQLPFRDFVTVGLLVDRLCLENKTKYKTLGNIVPDCWIYVQDTDVKLGRIQIFNNWSPYMVADPCKHVWIGLEYFCTEGDDFWSMSDEQTVEFAKNELVKMGIIKPESVFDSHCERIKKAYPAYFDGYKHIGDITQYLNGFENLYCIGRNGQHRYNNMDHSMVTAFEAVSNIIGGIADKSNIWNVNTDKAYHEQKEE